MKDLKRKRHEGNQEVDEKGLVGENIRGGKEWPAITSVCHIVVLKTKLDLFYSVSDL